MEKVNGIGICKCEIGVDVVGKKSGIGVNGRMINMM